MQVLVDDDPAMVTMRLQNRWPFQYRARGEQSCLEISIAFRASLDFLGEDVRQLPAANSGAQPPLHDWLCALNIMSTTPDLDLRYFRVKYIPGKANGPIPNFNNG